jgi:hypothetical protein
MARAEEVLSFDGFAVTVRELTLGEVRAWAVRVDAGMIPFDSAALGIIADCEVADLGVMSSLTAEQADTLTGAELNRIADAARKLNPNFFALRAAISAAARTIAEEVRSQYLSTTPPAS